MSNCRSPSEGDVASKQVVYLTQEDLFQRCTGWFFNWSWQDFSKYKKKTKYPNWSYQKIICLRKQQSIGTADVQQQCVKCSEQGINQNWKEFPPQFLQIEGSDCHHGADELVGRCLALHQQRREEGQASGDAQVRKSSFNQLQMPWVSQHQRVSLLRKRISTSGALHPRQIKPVPAPPCVPVLGSGDQGWSGHQHESWCFSLWDAP